MEKYAIRLPEHLQFSNDEFFAFCQANRDLKFERNPEGEIIIMSPTGGITGKRNNKLSAKLDYWNEIHSQGEVFNSSTGFLLPSGAMRSPDAAWVARARWEALSYEEQEKFPPLCPDFVVELMSSSDSLSAAQEKMREWMDNGCRLGWLIFPKEERALIYEGQAIEEISGFNQTISGSTILPGFTFDLAWLK